jgi:hypothetical protein
MQNQYKAMKNWRRQWESKYFSPDAFNTCYVAVTRKPAFRYLGPIERPFYMKISYQLF